MNVYYDPGKFGLTIAGEAGYDHYEFNKFVVWRDGGGNLLWGFDSGCSCAAPFEGFGLGDLHGGTAHEVHKALDEWESSTYFPDSGSVSELHGKIAAL